MKVIDLLNKIANCEEVPKEIKIKTSEGTIAPFFLSDDEYINVYTGDSLLQCLDEFELNDKLYISDEEYDFIDIEEITSVENSPKEFYNFSKKINALIKNQKKLIERLNNASINNIM